MSADNSVACTAVISDRLLEETHWMLSRELTGWLIPYLTALIFGWLTDYVTNWLVHWLIEWLTDYACICRRLPLWVTHSLASLLTRWPSDFSSFFIDWLIAWLTALLTVYVADFLNGWIISLVFLLTRCLLEWVAGSLTNSLHMSPTSSMGDLFSEWLTD
jgi:hypothetical protein